MPGADLIIGDVDKNEAGSVDEENDSVSMVAGTNEAASGMFDKLLQMLLVRFEAAMLGRLLGKETGKLGVMAMVEDKVA